MEKDIDIESGNAGELEKAIGEYFRTECNYESLMEDAALAQGQIIYLVACLGNENVAIDKIADFMYEVLELLVRIRKAFK